MYGTFLRGLISSTLRWLLLISTLTSLDLVPLETGTRMSKSNRVWDHLYLSISAPLYVSDTFSAAAVTCFTNSDDFAELGGGRLIGSSSVMGSIEGGVSRSLVSASLISSVSRLRVSSSYFLNAWEKLEILNPREAPKKYQLLEVN